MPGELFFNLNLDSPYFFNLNLDSPYFFNLNLDSPYFFQFKPRFSLYFNLNLDSPYFFTLNSDISRESNFSYFIKICFCENLKRGSEEICKILISVFIHFTSFHTFLTLRNSRGKYRLCAVTMARYISRDQG